MQFELTDEQKQVRDMVHEFAHREVAPHIQEWDAKGEFHREALDKMGELGILGLPIPEEYGGAGLDYVSLALACEELEYVDTFLRVVMSVHVGLNSLALWQWATEEQRQRWLLPQAQGEKLATFALTEPNAGSDAGAIETTAVRDGDSYVINGAKMWISLADVADHFLVFASIDRNQKHKGLTAFVLERGMDGFTTGSIKGKLGVRAGNTGELAFNNVQVPAENRIGEEGEGFKIAMSCIDQGRFTVAAGAVGLTRACLDTSVKYANERQ
ncbi:MAG: acyl-CoA dehydrogenase family protein, partial [Gemmatimonadota bacterium]|nr:acyl-CoA dehydrogenase family protein [Gemmatimonadota bacterium]